MAGRGATPRAAPGVALHVVRVRRRDPRCLSRGCGAMKVFLLPSQPLAPPWNGGDKNLARTLLLGEAGVDFIFVGEHYDPSPWPRRHERLMMRSTGFMPS